MIRARRILQLMAEHDGPSGGAELGEARVTVVVLPSADRAPLSKLLGGRGVRVALAFAALIAVSAAGAIIVAARGTRTLRAAGRSTGIESLQFGDADAVATRFGIRVRCPRLAIVSPDGTYARVDFDHDVPCGTFGNYSTIILRRVRGVWVREFEATGLRCPRNWLAPSVLAELELCPQPVAQSRRAAPRKR